MPQGESHRSRPLRRQLLLLAIGAMLPLALLAIAGLVYDFGEQNELAHQRALETTRALASAVDAEVDRAFSALRVLAASELLDRDDIAGFEKVARRAAASQPRWRFMSLADASGRHVINTFFQPGEALPDRQRESDSFQRALATGEPQVGLMVNGRNGWSYPVRYPVVRDGAVRYVLTAVADPHAVHEILTRQRVSDEWVVSVFDSAGARVARSKMHDKLIGTRAHETLRNLLAQGRPEGTGITMTLEGSRVFTAYTRLPRSNWVVVMGLPVAAVQAPAWTSLAITSTVVLLTLIAGIVAAIFLARRITVPMEELALATNALARGEPPSTVHASGVREVDQVAAALSNAAHELREVETERSDLLGRERHAREQAEHANRAKDQLLAMLGHELRNPLAALTNAATLLEMTRGDANAQAQVHGVIRRQVGNLARLTDDLLDTARAMLGKVELKRAPSDLARVASNALNAMAIGGRAGDHAIETDLQEAWVLGDEVRLEQVVCNLLVNATKYTPKGGRIRMTTRRQGGNAVLSVADEGQGMSPELAARAFDLFVQGERNADRGQGGLGIGLTLVRTLVQMHGGQVEVRSEGEDRGSEFTVTMPAIEHQAAAGAAESARVGAI